MTKRTLILTDDDDPPWSGIRPPWPRIANPYKYLRAELGHLICKKYPADNCVVCPCPIMDDCDEHDLTICRRGECDNVSLSCEEKHGSDQILEAIFAEIDD